MMLSAQRVPDRSQPRLRSKGSGSPVDRVGGNYGAASTAGHHSPLFSQKRHGLIDSASADTEPLCEFEPVWHLATNPDLGRQRSQFDRYAFVGGLHPSRVSK